MNRAVLLSHCAAVALALLVLSGAGSAHAQLAGPPSTAPDPGSFTLSGGSAITPSANSTTGSSVGNIIRSPTVAVATPAQNQAAAQLNVGSIPGASGDLSAVSGTGQTGATSGMPLESQAMSGLPVGMGGPMGQGANPNARNVRYHVAGQSETNSTIFLYRREHLT